MVSVFVSNLPPQILSGCFHSRVRESWPACSVLDATHDSNLVEDLGENSKWLPTSVYGPNDNQRRKEFWRELDMIRGRWKGSWCIGGDWNVIRFPNERLGGRRTSGNMTFFSDWINRHALMDPNLSGASYTWSNHQDPPVMSRLDRFLVSTDWIQLYHAGFKL